MERSGAAPFVALALSCIFLSAMTVPTLPQTQRLARLTDAQIAQTFIGKMVSPSDEGGVVVVTSARGFCPTGAFWQSNDRVRSDIGTFEIQNGRLCTSTARFTQCHYVFKNDAGVVQFSHHESGDRAWPVPFLNAEMPCGSLGRGY